jgi:hypothetical protein
LQIAPGGQFLDELGGIVDFNEEGGLQKMTVREQPIVKVQFQLHIPRIFQAGDAHNFLHAEPQGLPVLKDERETWADADAAIAVDIAAMGIKELPPPTGVFLQGQEIIDR